MDLLQGSPFILGPDCTRMGGTCGELDDLNGKEGWTDRFYDEVELRSRLRRPNHLLARSTTCTVTLPIAFPNMGTVHRAYLEAIDTIDITENRRVVSPRSIRPVR